jgi:hypothetical protein
MKIELRKEPGIFGPIYCVYVDDKFQTLGQTEEEGLVAMQKIKEWHLFGDKTTETIKTEEV